MSFTVRLANEDVSVEPGSSAPIAFEIENTGAKADEFEVSVEGVDPEWVAIPVPTLWVDPGQSNTERIFIKPPRQSESNAGIYPFVLKIRSLESGESRTAQCSLTVNSFAHLSVEVNPKKSSVNVLKRETSFEVTVMNLGNTDQNVQFFASDVDDAFAYEFSTTQASLEPGQTRTLELTATASKVKAFASTVIAPVSVSARSVDNLAVAANSQLHIEIRPLIATGPLIAVIAIIALTIGWILSIPKPPVIDSFTLESRSVELGQTAKVKWQTSNASSVTLVVGSQVITKLAPDDEYDIAPDTAGELEIQIYAQAGQVKSKVDTIKLTVTAPPVVPEPKIIKFSATKTEVPLGSSVLFNYELSDSVTYATLEPIGQIEVKARSIQVPSPPDDLPGKGVKTVTYTLRARNEKNVEVREQITIKFIKESKAIISQFSADPLEVDPLSGRVTIRWQVTGAAKLELKYSNRIDELTSMDDRRDFILTDDTEFILVAYDVAGLDTQKKIKVTLRKPNEDPPTQDPPGNTTGTTQNGSTGTTGGATRPVTGGQR
ncbi:MAG: hypothetical protein KF824_09490 [Fimbriimonadaceae bacterium]|nr:MAG: hypothetical protein KF824_09490 [Fimbriimonadaceae bacterium]